jgi:acyl-CoA synthetase (AMP-forming)/AMP-acid ligase II
MGDCAAVERAVGPDTRIIALFYEAEAPLDPARLSAHVTGKLAPYKHPRSYHHLPVLPRGPNGKLNRRALTQGRHDPA